MYKLASIILLSFALITTALAENDYPIAFPFTGKIQKVSVSSSNLGEYGAGNLTIEVVNDKGQMGSFTLDRGRSTTEDNSGFMAFYQMAQTAYLNELTVTVDEFKEPDARYKGYTLQLSHEQ